MVFVNVDFSKMKDKQIKECLDNNDISNYIKQQIIKRSGTMRYVIKVDKKTKTGFRLVKAPIWTKKMREKQRKIALSMPRNGYLFKSRT